MAALPAAATQQGAARLPSSAAQTASPGLLSLPPRWLQSYDDFIARNLGQVSQIESALRSLTYVIPGRFRDAEIASEAIHTGVQLLSLYHDLLLLRTPAVTGASGNKPSASSSSPSPYDSLQPPGPSPPPPSQHTRYTRYWIEKSPFYRRVAIVLRIVRYTELLCEMAAKRRGERLRWRVVVLIEAVKAVCRLLLLRVTRGRTVLQPEMPVRQPLLDGEAVEGEGGEEEEMAREEMPANRENHESRDIHSKTAPDAVTFSGPLSKPPKRPSMSPQPPLSPPPSPLPAKVTTMTMPGTTMLRTPPSPAPTVRRFSSATFSPLSTSQNKAWAMPRTGMALPPLPLPGDISAYLQGRVLSAEDIKPAPRLLNRLQGAGYAAEVLHILAPVVFAAALAGNSDKKKSKFAAWTPWLVGLAMECAARQLREHDNNGLRTTTLEHDEWSRRGWAMGWWTMRGAFYEHAMKGVVAGVRARVPSFVGSILEDYEYLWENYYFSTSP